MVDAQLASEVPLLLLALHQGRVEWALCPEKGGGLELQAKGESKRGTDSAQSFSGYNESRERCVER